CARFDEGYYFDYW
nr:immunoglobulin heavy chain junction region [Mus musculus]